MYIQIYKYVTLFVKQKTQFLGLSNCICPNRFRPSIYHFYMSRMLNEFWSHCHFEHNGTYMYNLYMYIYICVHYLSAKVQPI